MTDIEIAKNCKLKPISEIAKAAGISEEALEPYGKYKAKVDVKSFDCKGKLILVTAINPTPFGEGKTTVSIGLSDGLKRLGKKVIAALREPSLGPVFGIKGGAAGGGYSQVVPMDEINLHFTGDLHAITAANNLLSAIIDNHIFQGNILKLNPAKVVFRRCLDINDRSLRNIVTGLGKETDGVPMSNGFDITAASEVMAVLCLANDLNDLKKRLGSITVGYNYDNLPVYARDLKAENAMAILLKDALKPNLVQTLEGTPVFIHGGPFANIAHGCNSVTATKTALTYADYCVTEAGFGADLGAEKFLDVKCRAAGIAPSCVVLVATVRSLKWNGGAAKESLKQEDLKSLEKGLCNLSKHIENLTGVFKLPCVVAINRFDSDTDAEIKLIQTLCKNYSVTATVVTAFTDGGAGAANLAKEVLKECEKPSTLHYAYELFDSIEQKLLKVVKKVYGASTLNLQDKAKQEIKRIEAAGFSHLPVIIAKTQYSLSDNPKLLGRPTDFEISIKEIKLKSGAGFIVAQAGEIMLMPGLPKVPLSEQMEIDGDGNITGLS